MELPIGIVIFLFVICLCGGIVIGLMIAQTIKTLPKDSPEQEKDVQEPKPASSTLARKGDKRILQAWRDKMDKLWLEMDNQRLESSGDLNPEQGERLLAVLLDLRPWMEPSTPPPSKSSPTPSSTPPEKAAPYPKVITPPHAAPEPVKPRIDSAVMPKVEASSVSHKSMVDQIDDILQEKLAGTALAKLNIRLLEGASGEVMVQIGSMHHAGIDTIPNPEIQAIIRAAVAEWEKRAT